MAEEETKAEEGVEKIEERELELAEKFATWKEAHPAYERWWAGTGIIATTEMSEWERQIMDRLSPMMHYLQVRSTLDELVKMGVLSLERAMWLEGLWAALRRAKKRRVM
jgi:hypothetical protein